MFKIYQPKDLPKTLPLFPLTGMMLLPRMRFPLSMEEPHALSLVDDAFKGDRMIGIIQPKNTEGAMPPLYAIGTAGRITALDETDDGKYILGVTGVCRFHLVQEIPTARDYRVGEVNYADYLSDLHVPEPYHFQRRTLMTQLREFFDEQGIMVDWDMVGRTPDALLVNSLSVICPFDIAEKQALLEAVSVEKRLETLQTILTFANMPGDNNGGAQRVLN